ncbi:MAG: hypothetical protein VB099_18850 [Candidatus Limiplasma sp.]|nr:hypothetical protein [Candidatus Limiplasma sp.]
MEKNDKAKKQIPLRLSPQLYDKLAAWAEDEFRSVNGQIEYLLTECVKKRRGGKDFQEPEREEE